MKLQSRAHYYGPFAVVLGNWPPPKPANYSQPNNIQTGTAPGKRCNPSRLCSLVHWLAAPQDYCALRVCKKDTFSDFRTCLAPCRTGTKPTDPVLNPAVSLRQLAVPSPARSTPSDGATDSLPPTGRSAIPGADTTRRDSAMQTGPDDRPRPRLRQSR